MTFGFWTTFWGIAAAITLLVSFFTPRYRFRCIGVLLALNWVLWNVGTAFLGSAETIAVFPMIDGMAATVVLLLAVKHNKPWIWIIFLLYTAMLSSYVAYQSNAFFGHGDRVSFLTVMNALYGLQLLTVCIAGVREIVRAHNRSTGANDCPDSVSGRN